jgi:hypothetical protein
MHLLKNNNNNKKKPNQARLHVSIEICYRHPPPLLLLNLLPFVCERAQRVGILHFLSVRIWLGSGVSCSGVGGRWR